MTAVSRGATPAPPMSFTLRVWRQQSADADGAMSTYEVDGISPDMSFLEMLDVLNERLILAGECATACPKDIPLFSITAMNREFLRAARKGR